MKKLKYRATLDFDLHIGDDEVLDKDSLSDLKHEIIRLCKEWDTFYLYIDGKDEFYDGIAMPSRVNCKIRRRTGK